jgi:hypothetical protein
VVSEGSVVLLVAVTTAVIATLVPTAVIKSENLLASGPSQFQAAAHPVPSMMTHGECIPAP